MREANHLRTNLITLLKQQSVRRGQFTLSSGKLSSFYVDARLTTMDPRGLSIVGSLALAALQESGWAVDAVGGLTMGADPVAYAIAYASAQSPKPLRAFTVRKHPKEHGTSRLVEGPLRRGDIVAVVEDVITSGASALRAITAVESEGATVAGVLALVDREEGGVILLEQQGYRVASLIGIGELLSETPAN